MGKLLFFSHSDFTPTHKTDEEEDPREEKQIFGLVAPFQEVVDQRKTGPESPKMGQSLSLV